MNYLILTYCIAVSGIGYLMMWRDKKCAVHRRRRIPEKAFFVAALLGGTPGTILGMFYFRHKTRHWYFRLGLPIILVVQLVIICIVTYIFNN
jgi:uncharacterized membrane protein YsdA (DUF1294 family)